MITLLNSGEAPRVCSPEEEGWLLECLQRHPRAEEKLREGIIAFHIRPALYGRRGFFIERPDHSFADFSIYKCFRASLSKSSSDFRQAARAAAGVKVQTGKHLHHQEPWTFEAIVRAFLKENDLGAVEYGRSGMGVTFKDNALADRFKTFHDERAVLVYLSEDEHYKAHGKIKKQP
jgi:hypothetical protein